MARHPAICLSLIHGPISCWRTSAYRCWPVHLQRNKLGLKEEFQPEEMGLSLVDGNPFSTIKGVCIYTVTLKTKFIVCRF